MAQSHTSSDSLETVLEGQVGKSSMRPQRSASFNKYSRPKPRASRSDEPKFEVGPLAKHAFGVDPPVTVIGQCNNQDYNLCASQAKHPVDIKRIPRPPKGSGRRKTAASDGTSTPHIPTLAEQLSYLHHPRPFKNPHYSKNSNSRRAKNLKAVLTQERERERAERERRRSQRENPSEDAIAMQVDVEQDEEIPTYSSIEAPPSVLPQRRYCDITGLEAPYTDPATGLRYHDKSIYELIKGLSASAAKEYLAARGVNSIVK